MSKLLVGLST